MEEEKNKYTIMEDDRKKSEKNNTFNLMRMKCIDFIFERKLFFLLANYPVHTFEKIFNNSSHVKFKIFNPFLHLNPTILKF